MSEPDCEETTPIPSPPTPRGRSFLLIEVPKGALASLTLQCKQLGSSQVCGGQCHPPVPGHPGHDGLTRWSGAVMAEQGGGKGVCPGGPSRGGRGQAITVHPGDGRVVRGPERPRPPPLASSRSKMQCAWGNDERGPRHCLGAPSACSPQRAGSTHEVPLSGLQSEHPGPDAGGREASTQGQWRNCSWPSWFFIWNRK